jgi:NADH-quinone oxidoreductase subunit J
VLMIFVIMLLNLHPDDLKPMKAKGLAVVLALAGMGGVVFGQVFTQVLPSGEWKWADLPAGFGSVFSVGEKIFSGYLFPFEILSILLLTAMVGALVLSKRKL